MAIHYKDTSTIDWSSIELTRIKRENDLHLYRAIEHYIKLYRRKHLNMLSLPANKWVFERTMSDILQSTKGTCGFVGLEHDSKVYTQSVKTMKRLSKDYPDNKYNIHKIEVIDFLKRTADVFDIIYLDWMGTWNKLKREEITTIFKRELLSKNSLLIFTIMLYRGNGPVIEELDRLKDNDILSFPFYDCIDGEPTENFILKTTGITNKIAMLGLDHGYKIVLDWYNIYPGLSGQPEMSFAFRVI